MKALKTVFLGCLMAVSTMTQSSLAQGMSGSAFAPENFKTQIVKKILQGFSDPSQLRKTVIGFVNTSKATFMCKYEVAPIYDNFMKYKLVADLSEEQRKIPDVASTIQMLQQTTLVRLKNVDEYCATQQ